MNSLLDNLSPIFSELGAVLAKELLKQNPETNVIQHNENLNEKKEVVEGESNNKEQKKEDIVDDKPEENIVDTITLSKDEYKNFKLLERSINKKREKLKFLQEKVNNLIDFKKKYPGCATFDISRQTGKIEVIYTQYHHDDQHYFVFMNEETMIRECTKNNVNVAGNIFFNNRNLTYGDYENILSAYKNHISLEKEMSDLSRQIKDLKEELGM
jgi:hypothetical protein